MCLTHNKLPSMDGKLPLQSKNISTTVRTFLACVEPTLHIVALEGLSNFLPFVPKDATIVKSILKCQEMLNQSYRIQTSASP